MAARAVAAAAAHAAGGGLIWLWLLRSSGEGGIANSTPELRSSQSQIRAPCGGRAVLFSNLHKAAHRASRAHIARSTRGRLMGRGGGRERALPRHAPRARPAAVAVLARDARGRCGSGWREGAARELGGSLTRLAERWWPRLCLFGGVLWLCCRRGRGMMAWYLETSLMQSPPAKSTESP
eukprot:scaffold4370_cov317-Prasinococcus_capsulatus_cf.AAC.5